jgi:hypothetical protein
LYKGINETTEAFNLVADYLQRKSLKELGFTFKGEELSELDFQVYTMIHSEFAKLERKEAEKNGARNRTKNSR